MDYMLDRQMERAVDYMGKISSAIDGISRALNKQANAYARHVALMEKQFEASKENEDAGV